MINRKFMIFAIFLVSILAVSAVSAADDIASADKTADEVVSIEENQVILKESNDVGTFGDLQREINDAPEGSVLNLTRDYKGDEDAVVWLNKDLTVDGQGHTIDCLGDDCSAFYSDAGKITLKNLKIINGYNDDNYKGGAIYIGDSAKYTIINCTFSNNWADDYGGAIYNGANHLTIINCTFNNNIVDDYCGGAIYSYGLLTIENSIFNDNFAEMYGGAIYYLYGGVEEATIKNCQFNNNKVDDNDGGAICCFSVVGGGVYIENSTFNDNFGDNYGGAIFNNFLPLHIVNCNFNNNKADDDCGGAIYAGGTLYITNSSFTSNNADDNGGAIYAKGVSYITNSTFASNNADDYGGAIYSEANLDITNSSFTSNNADDDGGAIYCDNFVSVENCVFESNSAEVCGGAIYSKNNTSVKNTTFRNNKADGAISSQCCGGAIRCEEDVKVDSSTFIGNHAYDYGGAIYTNLLSWEPHPSYLIGNYVEDNQGGAIYTNRLMTWMEYAVFINNTVKADDDGGAIYIKDNYNDRFIHCYFENNRCGDDGGAIYFDSDDSHPWFEMNVFVDNWAGDMGHIAYAELSSKTSIFTTLQSYNWYGSNDFNFENGIVGYWNYVPHSERDDNMIRAVMIIDKNVEVGKEANLTIYFYGYWEHPNPDELLNINPTFSADNGAILSDWHTFKGSAYITGITLTNNNVTHITAQVHNQNFKLDVTPSKENLRLNVSADSISVGENATVVVTGLENATGNVSVFVNLTEWTGKIDNGVAKIIVTGLDKSTTAGVTYSGDENYNPVWTSVNIPVNRYDLNINASAKPITVGANATVIVTGLENATGNVTVTVNNKTYTAPIKYGESTVLIPGITENVTAVVNYAGDERYNPASTTVNITVNPAVDTKLESKIYLRNALYFVTQTKMVKVTLWDGNNKPIAGKTVHITLNAHNLTYSGVTDENGDAYIRVGVGFGVHNATVSFDGDDQYNASERTGQIRVIKETPSIMVRGDNQKFSVKDNPKTVKVYLWDRSSKPLPVNSKVAIKLNGITYIGYTDSQGIASIKINVNTPGTFNAQVTYAGNSAYNGVSRSVKFTIS